MMKKFLNTTSRQEYKAPTIKVDELEKQDVLTASAVVSGPDNNGVEAHEFEGFGDLLSSIFSD